MRSRILLSWCHQDKALKEALLRDLLPALGVFTDLDVEWWEDSHLTCGEELTAGIIDRLDEADFGLLLLSTRYFGRRFIRRHELPRFAGPSADKGSLPVALSPLLLGPAHPGLTPTCSHQALRAPPCGALGTSGASAGPSQIVHGLDKVFAGLGHSGADGADGTIAYLSGGCVIQAHYLGEYERVPAVGFQPGHQLPQQLTLFPPRSMVCPIRGHDGVLARDGFGAGPGISAPDLVGGHPASNRQQPGPDTGAVHEARKGPQGPQVSFLGKVLRRTACAQIGKEPVHLPLGNPNERRQGCAVAHARRERQCDDPCFI